MSETYTIVNDGDRYADDADKRRHTFTIEDIKIDILKRDKKDYKSKRLYHSAPRIEGDHEITQRLKSWVYSPQKVWRKAVLPFVWEKAGITKEEAKPVWSSDSAAASWVQWTVPWVPEHSSLFYGNWVPGFVLRGNPPSLKHKDVHVRVKVIV